jgi:hypothetical protein
MCGGENMENKQKHVIKLETKVTLGFEKPEFHLEKRRAAIHAALSAAIAGLAATTSGLAAQAVNLEAGDGGTPPWGEVIIEPVWQERNPEVGHVLSGGAELSFWE